MNKMEKTETKTIMPIPITCICCTAITTITMDMYQYFRWRRGFVFIQDAMPDLTDVERDMLVTGLCEQCQPN